MFTVVRTLFPVCYENANIESEEGTECASYCGKPSLGYGDERAGRAPWNGSEDLAQESSGVNGLSRVNKEGFNLRGTYSNSNHGTKSREKRNKEEK